MATPLIILPDTTAMIDDDDADLLRRYIWTFSDTGQPVAHCLAGLRLFHVELGRAVTNALPAETVVQVNPEDRFNYQKSNLRVVTPRRSLLSRLLTPRDISGLRGVTWHPVRRRYRVQAEHEGQLFEPGFYKDPVEAWQVFDAAAMHLGVLWPDCNFPHRFLSPEMKRAVARSRSRFTKGR